MINPYLTISAPHNLNQMLDKMKTTVGGIFYYQGLFAPEHKIRLNSQLRLVESDQVNKSKLLWRNNLTWRWSRFRLDAYDERDLTLGRSNKSAFSLWSHYKTVEGYLETQFKDLKYTGFSIGTSYKYSPHLKMVMIGQNTFEKSKSDITLGLEFKASEELETKAALVLGKQATLGIFYKIARGFNIEAVANFDHRILLKPDVNADAQTKRGIDSVQWGLKFKIDI